MIGGKGEQKTLRIVAEARRHLALVRARPPTSGTSSTCWRAGASEVGRDVSEITVSNELDRGGVDVEHADALYDAGVRLFTLGISGPDYDLAPVPTLARLAGREERLSSGCRDCGCLDVAEQRRRAEPSGYR